MTILLADNGNAKCTICHKIFNFFGFEHMVHINYEACDMGCDCPNAKLIEQIELFDDTAYNSSENND